MNSKTLKYYAWVTILLLFVIGYSSSAMAKTIRWKMGSCWSSSNALIDADRYFVKTVNELAAGKLKIKLFTVGEIVPAFGLFDAVRDGTLQAGGDWPGYWAGKDTAFSTLCGFPMLPRQIDYITWIYKGGGFEMYNEIYGKYGLVYFPYFIESAESGVRSNKRYAKLDDFKGSKIRMGGKLQSEALVELGAIPVSITGEEVYQALEKKMIDGAEFNLPYMDWQLGYQYVTTEQSAPAWQQPSTVMGVCINKKAWEKLPKDLQAVIKYSAQATVTWCIAHSSMESGKAQEQFLKRGVRVTYLDDAALDKIEKICRKNILEEAKKNPLFAKSIFSFFKTIQQVAPYRDLERPLLKRSVRFSESEMSELEKLGK
ncbi:MAG: TRAP transporter substrate-binding protein DctP [Thermodesulfobacteriota bacterium]|nr:TRAP transporter substrate-binding protein DctP [Thermodesulfobacteriota bacterium]